MPAACRRPLVAAVGVRGRLDAKQDALEFVAIGRWDAGVTTREGVGLCRVWRGEGREAIATHPRRDGAAATALILAARRTRIGSVERVLERDDLADQYGVGCPVGDGNDSRSLPQAEPRRGRPLADGPGDKPEDAAAALVAGRGAVHVETAAPAAHV